VPDFWRKVGNKKIVVASGLEFHPWQLVLGLLGISVVFLLGLGLVPVFS
jgi:hypothetical protein